MPSPTRLSTESVRLQKEIKNLLQVQGKLYFDFSPENMEVRLSLVTVSQRHGQPFLLHEHTGEDRTDALKNMLDYLRKPPSKAAFLFEVLWCKPDTPETSYTSHFWAKDVFEVLDKCYYQTKHKDLIIKRIERVEEED